MSEFERLVHCNERGRQQKDGGKEEEEDRQTVEEAKKERNKKNKEAKGLRFMHCAERYCSAFF